MTVNEAINMVNATKPNQFDSSVKIAWLSEIDGKIFNEVIKTHNNASIEAFTGHTSGDENLLISAPYDSIYLRWLEAQIDYANGDTRRYNVSATAFQAEYSQFTRYYNRTHMPIGKEITYF